MNSADHPNKVPHTLTCHLCSSPTGVPFYSFLIENQIRLACLKKQLNMILVVLQVIGGQQVQWSNSRCAGAHASTCDIVRKFKMVITSLLYRITSLRKLLSINFSNLWLGSMSCRDLSGNRLEGPIPPILGNLTSVTKLWVHTDITSMVVIVDMSDEVTWVR